MLPKLKGCLVLIVLAAVGCTADDPHSGDIKSHNQGSQLQKALEVAEKSSDALSGDPVDHALQQLESWGKVAVPVLKSLGHPELARLVEFGGGALSRIYKLYMIHKQTKGNKQGTGQRVLQGEQDMDRKDNEFPDPLRLDEKLEHEDKPKIDIAVFLSGFKNVELMKGLDLDVKFYGKDLGEIFRKRFTLPGRHLRSEAMRAGDDGLKTFWSEHITQEIQHPKGFWPGLGDKFIDPISPMEIESAMSGGLRGMGEPSTSGMGGPLFDLGPGGLTEPQLSGELDAPLDPEQPPKPLNKEKEMDELLENYDFDNLEQKRTEEPSNDIQKQVQPANDPKTGVYTEPKYQQPKTPGQYNPQYLIPNNKQPRAPSQNPHHQANTLGQIPQANYQQPNTQSKYQPPNNTGQYPLHHSQRRLDPGPHPQPNSPHAQRNHQPQIIGKQNRPYMDPARDLSSNTGVPDGSPKVDTPEKEVPKIIGNIASRYPKPHGPPNKEPEPNAVLQHPEQDKLSITTAKGTQNQTERSKHPKINKKTDDSVPPKQQTGEKESKPRLTQTGGNSTVNKNIVSPPLNYPNNKKPVQFYPRTPIRKPRPGVSKWKIPTKIGNKIQWSNGKWSLRRNNAGQYRPHIRHSVRPLRTE